MAKKLDQVTVKRLKSIGVSAKTEEEAREALLEIMKKSGIDGMESEDLDSLIDIAEAFTDDDAKGGNDDDDDNEEAGEETEEPTEEEEAEELANEAEEEEETEEEVEEPYEEEEAEEDGDEFDEMDRTQLKAYIKEKGLDIKVMKKWDDDTLREAIREAIGAAEEDMGEKEETEEEEEQKPQPKKKAAPVTAKEKKEEKKPAKKEKAATEKKPAKKRGTKLDPKNNEDDRSEFRALQKLFPEKDFEYAWLATAGVTVKHKGANGNRSIITIENCSKQEDGTVKCNAYLLTFTKQKELLDEAGVEYEPCWNGAPSIKGITLDEVIEIVSGFMDNILASVKKIDKKLGENRKKMEENLEKKAAKKPVAKKAAPDPEPDEEEEAEEEKPKKKAAAKPAKKAVKK